MSTMNQEFTLGEVQEPPSIGLPARALTGPENLQPDQFLSDQARSFAYCRRIALVIAKVTSSGPDID